MMDRIAKAAHVKLLQLSDVASVEDCPCFRSMQQGCQNIADLELGGGLDIVLISVLFLEDSNVFGLPVDP